MFVHKNPFQHPKSKSVSQQLFSSSMTLNRSTTGQVCTYRSSDILPKSEYFVMSWRVHVWVSSFIVWICTAVVRPRSSHETDLDENDVQYVVIHSNRSNFGNAQRHLSSIGRTASDWWKRCLDTTQQPPCGQRIWMVTLLVQSKRWLTGSKGFKFSQFSFVIYRNDIGDSVRPTKRLQQERWVLC